MKAIMLMFDSLKRDWLPPYGGDIIAPNFERLAKQTVRFDNFYIGSMPCMPARRELHTGRYNFLHEGWSPLEPYDDSMPEILRNAGVHTHLISDHHHYWREGGGNYHARYSTYEHVRGQEGDPWKAEVGAGFENTTMMEQLSGPFTKMFAQDSVNRRYMAEESQHSQTLCYDLGLEFIEKNKSADNWFLTVECFDPHEPFFTYEQYKEQYPHKYTGRHVDWPSPGTADQDADYVGYVQNQYKALVTMLDKNLGRVLDVMDQNDMWKDTMLVVNTDHGLLLGEHDWWSKGAMPAYNDIARLPFFIWDPRYGVKGETRKALAQNIDVCATLLEFFGQPLTKDMEGRPLAGVIRDDTPNHDAVLYGYFGGNTNITDGKYTYIRGPVNPDNAPLCEYTLIPARMGSRASVKELQELELREPFAFTKGCRTLKIDMSSHNTPFSNMYRYGNRLYDLEKDPGQTTKLKDPETELRLIRKMMDMMKRNDAPEEQYKRMGLWDGMTEEDLKKQNEDFLKNQQMDVLTEYEWDIHAANQFKTIVALMGNPQLQEGFKEYAEQNHLQSIIPKDVYAFANTALDKKQTGMLMMMLRLSERSD